MKPAYRVRPSSAIRGAIRPPGSKSLTNRAMVCSALAEGESRLVGALDSDDTRVMRAAIERLGIAIAFDPPTRTISVRGCAGTIPAGGAELFVANSGTTARFLAAMVALGRGTFRLDGTPRMRQRPIRDLLDALSQLGVSAESELGNGCPPIAIRAGGIAGGAARIKGDVSSQFLSGLLMAAPYAASPVRIVVEGPLVSIPYVEMTLAVMSEFGVSVEREGVREFRIAAGDVYRERTYEIEPDASAASYFFAAAAIAGGEVEVLGLSRASLQGDVDFVNLLARMGCEVRDTAQGIAVRGGPLDAIDADMNEISDTVQTLAAVALFARGTTNIRGVAHIRHKETDRIAALACELRKLGATVEERDDGLSIAPGPIRPAAIDTYDDHRMAMSLALVGLAAPGIEINDPGCTAKTYPEFFADLERLAGTARDT